MGRKRAGGVVDLSSCSDSDNDEELKDIQCSQLPTEDRDSFDSISDSLVFQEDDSSSDNSSFNRHLYEKCLKDYEEIKNLKRNLQMALKHKSKKSKCEKSNNDGFTRFSVKAFSNVISALSSDQKAVIERHGFGSLLMFNRCFVPNKFAQWVARLVDSKSGDIVHDGKVISLSEESMHLVLDLPVGNRPFPSDGSTSKEIVLSKFGKDWMPPISFFLDKLINNADLSDEDMFICFMVVALSCFLCPNTNSFPSPKYFGIFEDIEHMKELNWCGFVLEWLLDHVKAFNRGKADRVKRCQGLGGCIYYLAVVYLDHIDFRKRQVADSIPRISVWKENMIQYYSNLDLKSVGVYGYRPLVDFEKTCYYKCIRLRTLSSSAGLDVAFCAKMEHVSGCKLPLSLKLKISKLIDEHTFNGGLSLNMDVTSLRNVSHEFQEVFARLMRHVCSIDERTKDLVLDLMKAIAETDPSIDDDTPSAVHPSSSIAGGAVTSSALRTPNIIDLEQNVKNLKKSSSGVMTQCLKSMAFGDKRTVVAPVNASVRNPLVDISNILSGSGCRNSSTDLDNDVIVIEKENVVVPDSVSPVPYRFKSGLVSSKKLQFSQKDQVSNRDEELIYMQTIPLSDDESPHITPNLSRKSPMLRLSRSSIKMGDGSLGCRKDNSAVVCTGSRSLSDKLKEQCKKSENLYNSKLPKASVSIKTPLSLNKTHGFPCNSGVGQEGASTMSKFREKDSSTGGKLPPYGPRRLVCPSRALGDDFVNNESKFKVSKSEVANYKAICGLASSRSSNEDALYFQDVRCTYWSLGESLKPGGQINDFVVAAFCYHLFYRPDGHPDISKRHYFFSNISDNLLKDHDDVACDVMMRAFNRSAKARPLHRSNLLYFPTCYENHWFVFVVDIKDKKFVFLDSLYNEDHAYQEYVRSKMIPEFQYWWGKFVNIDMKFHEYGVIYPSVPKHSPYDDVDSGVYSMMFLEHWTSPRSSIFSLFTSEDVPSIRMKLANEMVFNPRNSGNKNPVITYDHEQDGGSE